PILLALAAVFIIAIVACGNPAPTPTGQRAPAASSGMSGLPADAAQVAAERGLPPDDIYAAMKTYTPSGQLDPYIMFASGGQGGQVLVIGVPSMRVLYFLSCFYSLAWAC